jgi:hypothetical protein
MGQLTPNASDTYDRQNEQQARRALENAITDLQAQMYALLTTAGTLRLADGDITVANGSNNDLAIGYSTYARLNGPSAAFTLTGFAGGELGRFLILRNTTAYQMTIANQSSSSIAANRITTNTGADVVLQAGSGASATFEYDATLGSWVLISHSGTNVIATGVKAVLGLRISPTAITGNISSVDTSTDQITWSTNHNLTSGDVIYSTGGTWPTGITGAAPYYARAVSATIFSLHTSKAGAIANTGRVDITLAGSGTQTMNKLFQTVKFSLGISESSNWIAGRTDVANSVILSITFSPAGYCLAMGVLTDNTNFVAYQMQFRNTSSATSIEMDPYTVTGTTLLWSALATGATYDLGFVAYGAV